MVPHRPDLTLAGRLHHAVNLIHPVFQVVGRQPGLISFFRSQKALGFALLRECRLRGGGRPRAAHRVLHPRGHHFERFGTVRTTNLLSALQHAGRRGQPQGGVVFRRQRQQEPPLGLGVAVGQQHMRHPITGRRRKPRGLGGLASLAVAPPRHHPRASLNRLHDIQVLRRLKNGARDTVGRTLGKPHQRPATVRRAFLVADAPDTHQRRQLGR